MHTRTLASLLVISCLAFGEAGMAAAQTPPAGNKFLTAEEVRKLVDAGQYKDALRGVIRILDLNGPAAAPYDRFDMLMVKAECQLQVHANAAAIKTLQDAKALATKDDKPNDFLRADGLSLLIQKSPGDHYTPVTAKIKKPIDILDHDARKGAYQAMFDDLFAQFQKKSGAAIRSMTLPPYLIAAKSVQEMRAAEYCATDNTSQTDDAVKDLGEHAAKLLANGVDGMSSRTDRITNAANRLIIENTTLTDNAGHSFPGTITRKQGLTLQDQNALKGIIADCEKIPPYAKELAKAFVGQASKFMDAALKAEDVKKQADTTLHQDYSTPMP